MPSSSEHSESSAAGLYKGESGRAYHEGKRALDQQGLQWVARARARKFQGYIAPGAAVLEYGVGAGWNLAALRCGRRIGFDVSDLVEAKVKLLGIEFVSDLSGFPDASADTIICHHVLEHLQSPAAALEEMRRLLRPAGKLIAHVPWDREWRHSKYQPQEPNHHLYTWNAQSLGNLLMLKDFTINQIRVQRYGYDRISANLAARLGIGESGFKVLRKVMAFLRPLYEVEAVCIR